MALQTKELRREASRYLLSLAVTAPFTRVFIPLQGSIRRLPFLIYC
uniref:Exocyst complex component Sec8 n=1 Tax=Parascaris univalens TaxID=6257 RepID=A0A915ACC0_PARUN